MDPTTATIIITILGTLLAISVAMLVGFISGFFGHFKELRAQVKTACEEIRIIQTKLDFIEEHWRKLNGKLNGKL